MVNTSLSLGRLSWRPLFQSPAGGRTFTRYYSAIALPQRFAGSPIIRVCRGGEPLELALKIESDLRKLSRQINRDRRPDRFWRKK